MTRTEGSNVRPYDGTLELLRAASSESVLLILYTFLIASSESVLSILYTFLIASSERVLSLLYTSYRFVPFFYVHKLFTKVSIIFFAKMLTNNMVGAILIYERY